MRGAFRYPRAVHRMQISQTTIDMLTALVIYGAGSTMLRLALIALRDRLRDGD